MSYVDLDLEIAEKLADLLETALVCREGLESTEVEDLETDIEALAMIQCFNTVGHYFWGLKRKKIKRVIGPLMDSIKHMTNDCNRPVYSSINWSIVFELCDYIASGKIVRKLRKLASIENLSTARDYTEIDVGRLTLKVLRQIAEDFKDRWTNINRVGVYLNNVKCIDHEYSSVTFVLDVESFEDISSWEDTSDEIEGILVNQFRGDIDFTTRDSLVNLESYFEDEEEISSITEGEERKQLFWIYNSRRDDRGTIELLTSIYDFLRDFVVISKLYFSKEHDPIEDYETIPLLESQLDSVSKHIDTLAKRGYSSKNLKFIEYVLDMYNRSRVLSHISLTALDNIKWIRIDIEGKDLVNSLEEEIMELRNSVPDFESDEDIGSLIQKLSSVLEEWNIDPYPNLPIMVDSTSELLKKLVNCYSSREDFSFLNYGDIAWAAEFSARGAISWSRYLKICSDILNGLKKHKENSQ